MPPKGQIAGRGSRAPQPKSFARTAYEELTSAENRQVLTALGVFVAGVAFFHSSLGEIILPP
ncbi:uncharacterized protein PV09_08569 [Verruconis gallopava]|uniref:TOM core complex subunit Tom6 n=1 Tax=Verruconis gallopava TaxID=253628 RepID=A0A0D2AL29_9PEZI|nr:uncharacterized protein PV09_08569 [Verruconis gallopava]KIV99763.1 hypothetical protein PV09_08569 [Verruconis gallopava]